MWTFYTFEVFYFFPSAKLVVRPPDRQEVLGSNPGWDLKFVAEIIATRDSARFHSKKEIIFYWAFKAETLNLSFKERRLVNRKVSSCWVHQIHAVFVPTLVESFDFVKLQVFTGKFWLTFRFCWLKNNEVRLCSHDFGSLVVVVINNHVLPRLELTGSKWQDGWRNWRGYWNKVN